MTITSKVLFILGPNLEDLEAFQPSSLNSFMIHVDIMIGFYGIEGGELFRLRICDPNSFADEVKAWEPNFFNGYLVLSTYDYSIIQSMIIKTFDEIEGDDIHHLMRIFSSYAMYADELQS